MLSRLTCMLSISFPNTVVILPQTRNELVGSYIQIVSMGSGDAPVPFSHSLFQSYPFVEVFKLLTFLYHFQSVVSQPQHSFTNVDRWFSFCLFSYLRSRQHAVCSGVYSHGDLSRPQLHHSPSGSRHAANPDYSKS